MIDAPEISNRAADPGDQQLGLPPPDPESPLGEPRLDPPHATLASRPPADESCAFPAESPDAIADTHERLQQQAAELAAHLRGWQADLDRRECRLIEHLALLEDEERRFRLWAREKESELLAREQFLETRCG